MTRLAENQVSGNGHDVDASGAADRDQPQMARLPWYPRDFASATRGWPVTARGVYRELLDTQWDMASLPADPRELRALIGATPNEWKAWVLIEPKFPIGADGRRRNRRLERHRQKAIELLERQRAGAASTNMKLHGGRQ
jgi:uncharacterized protein YdaU (DUF1376 family)